MCRASRIELFPITLHVERGRARHFATRERRCPLLASQPARRILRDRVTSSQLRISRPTDQSTPLQKHAALPIHLLPMLSMSSKPFDDPGCVFDTKWDGIRALASVEGKHQ
jgi:hypothetical protein